MSGIARPSRESSARRRSVLRVLKAAPDPMGITAIAEVLGVHPNTVRFHLDTLVSDGRVEQVEPGRRGPGRPPLMFRAIREMDPNGPRHYRLLAEILAMSLVAGRDPGGEALAAGRAWARKSESPPPRGKGWDANKSIDHLIGVLDEFGFAPERRKSGTEPQIGLRHCPFLEFAETQTEVACSIHLGLMQGVLEGSAAPVAVNRLDAFVEPGLCLTHLTLDEAVR